MSSNDALRKIRMSDGNPRATLCGNSGGFLNQTISNCENTAGTAETFDEDVVSRRNVSRYRGVDNGFLANSTATGTHQRLVCSVLYIAGYWQHSGNRRSASRGFT